MIKKRFVSVCLVLIMAMSLGLSSQVFASELGEQYSFYNMNESGSTNWKYKSMTSVVYVHPTYGPSMNYTVMGASSNNSSNSGSIESSTYLIQPGAYMGIPNTVREHGKSYARLFYSRSGNKAQVYSGGYWSPDYASVS